MVEELIIFPDKRIEIPSPDVREFGPNLAQIIKNLKDTIEAHDAEGLAAIQCAIPAAVVVIKKEDGSYLELVNPRIIQSDGSVESIESTLYLPSITETVPRYEKIKLIYQDASGTQQSMDVDGKLSLLIQRKVDYVYGGSFATKLAHGKKKDITKKMQQRGYAGSLETCPTEPMKKDFISSFMTKILIVGFILLAVSFFVSSETKETFSTINAVIMIAMIPLIISYYFVGLSDSKKHTSCTSCQVGNLVGTMIRFALFATLLFVGNLLLL